MKTSLDRQWRIEERNESLLDLADDVEYLLARSHVEITAPLATALAELFGLAKGGFIPDPASIALLFDRIGDMVISKPNDPLIMLTWDRLRQLHYKQPTVPHMTVYAQGMSSIVPEPADQSVLERCDFITAVMLTCHSHPTSVCAIIHDGTPAPVKLTSLAVGVRRSSTCKGCWIPTTGKPLSVGGCKSAGGVMSVAKQILRSAGRHGTDFSGPYLLSGGKLSPVPLEATL